MKLLKQSGFYFIILISTLVIIVTLFSLIHELTFWYFKILDFPRFQYLILAIICLILFVISNKKWGFASIFLILGIASSITIQSQLLLPYFIGKKAVPDADQRKAKQNNSVGILIANVLITNKKSADLLQIVEQVNPDMVLLMEVDEWWINELKPLKKMYPYGIRYPLDNSYGMALYSKLHLENSEIKFFNQKDVPSFHTKVVLPSGKAFMFHGMHPVAPVPSDKYPDNVGEDEVSLIKVGQIVARDSLPSVVAGDFNDVSWSHASRLFESKGNLNNVRLGRGLYNTFNAKSLLLRWPLDHYFATKEFALLKLRRLPDINSDHFPIFCRLVLQM